MLLFLLGACLTVPSSVVDGTDTSAPDSSSPADTSVPADTSPTDLPAEEPLPEFSAPEFIGDLSTQYVTSVSDDRGVISLVVDVEAGVSSFMLSMLSDERLVVDAVYDPSGVKVLDADQWRSGSENLTNAIFLDRVDNTLQWPIRSIDGALQVGAYRVDVAVIDSNNYYSAGVSVDFTLQKKVDSDPSTGTVSVELIFASGLGDSAEITNAFDSAFGWWRGIWGQRNLDLDLSLWTSDLNTVVSMPGGADSASFEGLSASGTESNLTVLVVDSVDGESVYGVSGGIPGTLISSGGAVVIISWLQHAGTDGVFNDAEIQILGETLAHEVGHYMGLFHPVELSYTSWDALSDTQSCSTESACVQALGQNVMFPTPVCSWNGCEAQNTLSSQQSQVLQLYTGTL